MLHHGILEEDYYNGRSRRRLEPIEFNRREEAEGFSVLMSTDPAAVKRASVSQFLKHALSVCCSLATVSEAGKKKTEFYQLSSSTRRRASANGAGGCGAQEDHQPNQGKQRTSRSSQSTSAKSVCQ